MSLTTTALRAIWAASDESDRAGLVDLARQGDALVRAQGGTAPQYPASNLTASSTGDHWTIWAEGYDAAHAATAGTMPLSILWAGASAWDPRGDAILSGLYDLFTGAGAAPVWGTVLERLRSAPQAVRQLGDWFAARGPQLQQGDQQDKTRDNLQRGWWWTYAQTLRQPTASDPAVGSYPAGTTTPAGQLPAGTATTTTGGMGTGTIVAIAAGVLFVASRRKGRR